MSKVDEAISSKINTLFRNMMVCARKNVGKKAENSDVSRAE